MRTDIEFNAEGPILRGWHYVPDQGQGPFPTIIMAHGSAALKEQYLDRYAEVFAAAGLASIVYDHRNFGESDGDVRQEIDPVLQMRDYRHAVTFAHDAAERRSGQDRRLGDEPQRRPRPDACGAGSAGGCLMVRDIGASLHSSRRGAARGRVAAAGVSINGSDRY